MTAHQPPEFCEDRGHPWHVSSVITPDGVVAFAGNAPVEFVRAVLREATAAWRTALTEGAA